MGNLEKTNQSLQTDNIYRVIHPVFFAFYDEFLRQLKTALPDIPRIHTNVQRFPDGSPYAQFIVGDGTVESKNSHPIKAIVPFWLADAGGYSVRESFAALFETLDALTGDVKGTSIADKIVVVSPYLSVRTDHPSHDAEGNELTGEALYGRMIANHLGIYPNTSIITTEIHGWDTANYLNQVGIPHLNLTAAPLFAQYIQEHELIDEKTTLISIDLGTLQRNWHLVNILGLDPEKYLVVFDKVRDDRGKIHSKLLYPNAKTIRKLGKTKGLSYDDIIDTFTSMGKNMTQLSEYGIQTHHMLATHATLSYPARKEITALFKGDQLKEIITTNSLPNPLFQFEDVDGINVLNIIPILAQASVMVANNHCIKEINSQPDYLRGTPYEALIPFILPPQEKQSVWLDFQKTFGKK